MGVSLDSKLRFALRAMRFGRMAKRGYDAYSAGCEVVDQLAEAKDAANDVLDATEPSLLEQLLDDEAGD